MGSQMMKNFHLPLPEQTYAHLRAEAERMQMPATTLAREAVDAWLRQQFRKARRGAIAAHAEEMSGTELGLHSSPGAAAGPHPLQAGKSARSTPTLFSVARLFL